MKRSIGVPQEGRIEGEEEDDEESLENSQEERFNIGFPSSNSFISFKE
jgi:hypothetical protein